MKKNKYTIRRKNILNVRLVSLTGQTWYDISDYETLIPWSGNTGFMPTGSTPVNGYVVYNVSGDTGNTLTQNYYKWGTPTGNTWNLMVGAPITNLTSTSSRNP